MTYPINEAEFMEKWLAAIDNPNEADKALVEAIFTSLTRAYNAGLEDGKKTA